MGMNTGYIILSDKCIDFAKERGKVGLFLLDNPFHHPEYMLRLANPFLITYG
jgi:hypothetical protein